MGKDSGINHEWWFIPLFLVLLSIFTVLYCKFNVYLPFFLLHVPSLKKLV